MDDADLGGQLDGCSEKPWRSQPYGPVHTEHAWAPPDQGCYYVRRRYHVGYSYQLIDDSSGDAVQGRAGMGFHDSNPWRLPDERSDMGIPAPGTGVAACAVADAESEDGARQQLDSCRSLEWQIVPRGQPSRR